MAKKDKLPVIITPKGVAAYAWLNKKDPMSEKFKITVLLDKKDMGEGRLNYGNEVVDGKAFIKHILDTAKSVGAPHKVGEDGCHIKDGDKHKNEDFRGKWLIQVKSDYQPKVVDTAGKALPDDETVFSGDVVKVAIQMKHQRTPAGKDFMPLYISRVMLIEKGERSSGLNFGDEEGYVADDAGLDFGVDNGSKDNEDF